MEYEVKERSERRHIEICFVRNLETLHEDDLRLVLRDKILPMPDIKAALQSQVRLAHSDEALAVMFNVSESEEDTSYFNLALRHSASEVELGCDAHIYVKGANLSDVRYFSRYDEGQRWYVAVVALHKIGLASDVKATEIDITLPHAAKEEAMQLHLTADLV